MIAPYLLSASVALVISLQVLCQVWLSLLVGLVGLGNFNAFVVPSLASERSDHGQYLVIIVNILVTIGPKSLLSQRFSAYYPTIKSHFAISY